MIYRRWSLLITPPLIVGAVVAVNYVYYFHLGGNERFFRNIREKYKHMEDSKKE